MRIFSTKAKSEDLISACRKGKPSAQRELYESYSGLVFGIAKRYMKDQYEAEEVLTSTFIKVFENLGKFEGKGSFEGWVKRIAVNEALGRLRRRGQMYAHKDVEEVYISTDDANAYDRLSEADLLKMIQNLPAGYSTVFNLYVIEGYSHKEIAEMLGVTESTSKSQLSRARVLLQKYLNESDNMILNKIVSHD